VLYTAAPDRGKLVTLVAGKQCPCCSRETNDKVFMTRLRSLNVTPETIEHNLLVCIGIYEAEITNNKRLYSTYCTVEAN